MFSRTVAFISHEACAQYPINLTLLVSVPVLGGISPRSAFRRVLFPEATGPVIMVILDDGRARLISWSTGGEPKEAFDTEMVFLVLMLVRTSDISLSSNSVTDV